MFITLNKSRDKFNISDYGISVTTLEEVFLKVAAGVKSIKPVQEVVDENNDEE
jgi:hypothetical protein